MERGGAGNGGRADWGEIFDLIASEYGYDIEQFLDLTYRLLYVCLERIAKRKHNNYAAQAALHGIKIELNQKRFSSPPPQEDFLLSAEKSALEFLKKQRTKNG